MNKQRYGQMIRLLPECEAEYIRLHSAVWPKVLEMIKLCHIQNYSIFFRDNYLFAYFEYTGKNFEADMERMAADPETQRWWELVKPLMEPLDTRKKDEFWSNMQEVFYLE